MRVSATQVIVLILIVVLLFGAKRLPDLARSLGQSLRIIKDETKSLADSDDEPGKTDKPSGKDGE